MTPPRPARGFDGRRPARALLRDILEELAARALALPRAGGRVCLIVEMSGAEFDALAAAGAALDDLEPEPGDDDGLDEAPWQAAGGAVA